MNCGRCRFFNAKDVHDDRLWGPQERRYGFCTNPASWHAHKAMPPDEGCTRWAEKDEGEAA